jgi:multidrug efflux pump subunit AcrA (membrane-fusion protein)
MKNLRFWLAIPIVLVLVVAGYTLYQTQLAPVPATPAPAPAAQSGGPSLVSAEAEIVPVRDSTLAFKIGGPVAEVLVAPGDVVTAGQTLVRLSAPELAAALAQAEAGLASAQARLAQAEAGATAEDLAIAELQIKAAQAKAAQADAQRDTLVAGARTQQVTIAEAQLAEAQGQLRLAESMHDRTMSSDLISGPTEWMAREQRDVTAAQVTAAQAQLDLVKAGASWNERRAANSGVDAADVQVELAQAQLAHLKAGASPEDLAVLRAGVVQAEAAVEQARAAYAQAELHAPFAGTVTDVRLEVGEFAAPGVPVVVLATTGAWEVHTKDLSEVDVVYVREGQSVQVTVDALPGQTFTGRVRTIALMSAQNRGDTVYQVKVALVDVPADAPLRWGMKAFVEINLP